jgi:hypothetical protein
MNGTHTFENGGLACIVCGQNAQGWQTGTPLALRCDDNPTTTPDTTTTTATRDNAEIVMRETEALTHSVCPSARDGEHVWRLAKSLERVVCENCGKRVEMTSASTARPGEPQAQQV